MNQLIPKVEKKDLSSIFRVLTERQDTDTQVFSNNFILKIKDIGVLAKAMDEQLKLYTQMALTTSASVEFSDNRTKDFHSIEELGKFNFNKSVTTSSVSLRWNLLLDSQEERPLEHNIVVKIASGVKPQDFLRAAFSKDIDDIDTFEIASAGCVCHITFATQSLAGDIFRIVQEWVKGRPKSQFSVPYLKFLKRHSEFIGKVIRFTLPISAVSSVLAYYCYSTRGMDQTSAVSVEFVRLSMFYGVALWFTYLITRILSNLLSSHLERLLYRIGKFHPFCLTDGDENKQTELIAKNQKSFYKFVIEGSIAVVWNIAAGIVIYCFTKPEG